MMDRLRSLMQTLGVTAFLICVLSLAGPGVSHARPSHASGHGDVPSVTAAQDIPSVAASEDDCRSPQETAAHDGRPSCAKDAPVGLEFVRTMARAERCAATIGGNAASRGDAAGRGDDTSC
jgi:hypothetical protein